MLGLEAGSDAGGAHASDAPIPLLVNGPAVGLTNLGNTCFFNSAVQVLLACPHLQNAAAASVASRRSQSQAAGSAAAGPTLGRGPLGFALQQAFLNINGARRLLATLRTPTAPAGPTSPQELPYLPDRSRQLTVAAVPPLRLHTAGPHSHHHHAGTHGHQHHHQQHKSATYNPQALLAAVCRVAPQFKVRRRGNAPYPHRQQVSCMTAATATST